jgi:hypothetical protein
MGASNAALIGECLYPERSFVFDEQNSSSYRKEIAHMARYYRLHLGSSLDTKTREEKLVTPMLMDLDGNRKVLAIHVHGDEKIRLWKRWGDGYHGLDITGNRSNMHMEVSPFFDSVAII